MENYGMSEGSALRAWRLLQFRNFNTWKPHSHVAQILNNCTYATMVQVLTVWNPLLLWGTTYFYFCCFWKMLEKCFFTFVFFVFQKNCGKNNHHRSTHYPNIGIWVNRDNSYTVFVFGGPNSQVKKRSRYWIHRDLVLLKQFNNFKGNLMKILIGQFSQFPGSKT